MNINEGEIVKTKLAGLFTAFLCLAMVTGAFAATPSNNVSPFTEKTIQVTANPSTGYHWVPVYNKDHIKLVKDTFKANNPKAIGSSGVETFVFSGVKGSKIVLKYVKAGESKPLKTLSYVL
jgi:predicted secreted protein